MAQAKKKEDSKEVAPVKENANALSVADFADDLVQDSGLGTEDMGADDLQIPRIGIIQSLSPQRSKTKPEYIEGAEEGHIFNSVTNELMDGEEGIRVVPIKYNKVYIEWKPREDGGGLVAIHSDDSVLASCNRDKKGRYITDEEHIIAPTAEYFVYVLGAGGKKTPAVISMASTSLKQSKNWNSLMKGLEIEANGQIVNPPSFYGVYKMTAVPQSNDSGEWFRWEIKMDGTVADIENGKEIYSSAKQFLESIAKGDVKVAEHQEEVSGGAESDDDPM